MFICAWQTEILNQSQLKSYILLIQANKPDIVFNTKVKRFSSEQYQIFYEKYMLWNDSNKYANRDLVYKNCFKLQCKFYFWSSKRSIDFNRGLRLSTPIINYRLQNTERTNSSIIQQLQGKDLYNHCFKVLALFLHLIEAISTQLHWILLELCSL